MKNIKFKKYIIAGLCLFVVCAIFFIKNHKVSKSTINSNYHLSENEINKIDTNLSIILTPSKSSNPGDYIKAHQKEYDEIIKMEYGPKSKSQN